MQIFDNLRGKAAIRGTAEHFGQMPEEVRQEIQTCIDEAWNTDDPSVKKMQLELFPEGKPTPEQFIVTVAKHYKLKHNSK